MARVLQHELDAYWIIALWKAIHDGDPAPDTIALQAIESLTTYLRGAVVEESVVREMVEPLKKLGITLTELNGKSAPAPHTDMLIVPGGRTNNGRFRCFGFGSGHTICVPEIGDPAR